MAKMKVTFGQDYTKSKVQLDGEEILAVSAVLKTEPNCYSTLEVRQLSGDRVGPNQILCARLHAPLEIEVDVPVSWLQHASFRRS